ncbi:hypothetical protein HNY73_001248 [Argiope bruennichi]|uniref:GAG-pre-integrase domain-containing protein n=1 Tax=Argiope bruennichi TaxID=94029 RepID=A0A8T0G4E7_ARGBR|nr:hypothetical protein HNY73_001248 [Argiope bruennichi]
MERNCWWIVIGSEIKPDETKCKELKNFYCRKDKAYSAIYLNISNNYRCIIADIEDPVVAWKRIEDHFQPDSRARIIGLTDVFFSCRINPQEEIGIYAARIRIVDQLKDAVKEVKTRPGFSTRLLHHTSVETEVFSRTIYRPVKGTTMSVAIGGVQCDIEGIGTVKMIYRNKGELEIVNLLNVMYSPKLRRNLISGSLIDKAGSTFTCKNGQITVYAKDGRKQFVAKKVNGLFCVNPQIEVHPDHKNVKANSHYKDVHKFKSKVQNYSTFNANNLIVWHNRMCHINKNDIIRTSKNKSVIGMPELKDMDLNCEPCKIAKSRHKSFKPIGKIRSIKPLELLHMDLCGSFPDVAIDDLGIKAERTNAYSPQQNGVAERYNYTAVDGIKVLLNTSGLTKGFGAEALLCHSYVWNRVCHGNQILTPFELYGGRKPSKDFWMHSLFRCPGPHALYIERISVCFPCPPSCWGLESVNDSSAAEGDSLDKPVPDESTSRYGGG